MAKSAQTLSSREFNQGTGRAKRAARSGPVYITERGRPSHVLLSYEHYRELTKGRPRLTDLLCRTPGAGDLDLEISRPDDLPRPFSFDSCTSSTPT
ncbi:MAG: type II toxin-antitoxin system Phd/YefM family antitoxin [Acidimicrobiia bacterium]|nr:type II toxin-antitoxin system Phd/YefM family antitoxin [Acidimicrobiia bacterium]